MTSSFRSIVMMSSRRYMGALALASIASPAFAQTCGNCQGFGVDFLGGGSYFQNTLSTDNFTFVSVFRGCQNDFAYNALINPNGDELYCSNTNLTPDGLNMLSTCPIQKLNLSSGKYSVIIESNNGDCQPVAFQRDFFITAGPQATQTVTPTVTIPVTSTPTALVNSVQTVLTTVLVPARWTVYQPGFLFQPTTTYTPGPSTYLTTRYLWTHTAVSTSASIVTSVVTATASCTTGPTQKTADPAPTWIPRGMPKIAGLNIPYRGAFANRANRMQAREDAEALALEKRAPDLPTVTSTETNTSKFSTTSKVVATAPLVTITSVATITVPTTVALPPSTSYIGVTQKQVTITAPQPTVTRTQIRGVEVVTITRQITQTLTLTTTTTPPAASTSCRARGGWING